jgi:hypothetical protein
MARWKKTSPRELRRRNASPLERTRTARERGEQCVVCFSIAWLYEHDHGREFEPLVENLVDALEAEGYHVWDTPQAEFDAALAELGRAHTGGDQRYLAVAVAAIERSWERGQEESAP